MEKELFKANLILIRSNLEQEVSYLYDKTAKKSGYLKVHIKTDKKSIKEFEGLEYLVNTIGKIITSLDVEY